MPCRKFGWITDEMEIQNGLRFIPSSRTLIGAIHPIPEKGKISNS